MPACTRGKVALGVYLVAHVFEIKINKKIIEKE